MSYTPFKKMVQKLAKKGVKDPKALAASIGRKKYGKKKFQAAAAAGKSLRNAKTMKGKK
jgi:hypothetical protein